jgi:hypothetical protein
MADEELVSRAALSVLNSIQVSKGVVTWRAQRPLARRLLDRLTGEQRRLDEVFDGHVANSLERLHTLIGVLRDQATESDLVLVKTINTLKSVRSHVETNSVEISSLKEELAALEQAMRIELNALWAEAQYGAAAADLLGAFKLLNADRYRGALSFGDLWLTVDRLWWGRVGQVIRRAPGSKEAAHLRALLIDEVRNLLRDHGFTGVFATQPLLQNILALPTPDESEVLELCTFDPTWRLRPLTSAVLTRSQGVPAPEEEYQRLPIVTSADTIGARLLDEADRGTKSS